MKVKRKRLFYKNIFLGTVSLNAVKLGALKSVCPDPSGEQGIR